MADFYENKQVTEEVILVGVALGETSVTDESLDELEELAKTAGAVTVGRLIQNREMIHPGTYLGKGKLEELAFLISETHATGIITGADGQYGGCAGYQGDGSYIADPGYFCPTGHNP